MDTSLFSFDPHHIDNQQKDCLIIQVPAGIGSKMELLQFLKASLHFPDYFGNNWDALEDCFLDLSWIKCRGIVINHGDVPLMDNRNDQLMYISILSNSIKHWGDSTDQHSLMVFFPSSAHAYMKNIN